MERQSPLDRIYAWTKANPAAVDGWIAGITAFLLASLSALTGYTYSTGGAGPAFLLGLGLTVPLAWRRSQPVLSAAAIAAVAYLQIVLVDGVLFADVGPLLSLYALAAYGPVWASRLGLGAGLFGALVAITRWLGPAVSTSVQFAIAAGFACSVVLAAWLFGHLRRLSVQNEHRMTERARLLEIERDQQAQLAATAERARIARELHDVVAHSLSVTVAQADGGRYAARSDPQAATAALETIAGTARQALTDMRALLGVLRETNGQVLAPQPSIGAIPALVDQVRASGLDVRLSVEGYGQPLAPGPELAAYRIVQESLTNVLKHAGPQAKAQVNLLWAAPGLTVVVSDDGRGAAAVPNQQNGSGQGVIGMRERAGLHGGTLEAGPRRSGGYAVRAFIPYVRRS